MPTSAPPRGEPSAPSRRTWPPNSPPPEPGHGRLVNQIVHVVLDDTTVVAAVRGNLPASA